MFSPSLSHYLSHATKEQYWLQREKPRTYLLVWRGGGKCRWIHYMVSHKIFPLSAFTFAEKAARSLKFQTGITKHYYVCNHFNNVAKSAFRSFYGMSCGTILEKKGAYWKTENFGPNSIWNYEFWNAPISIMPILVWTISYIGPKKKKCF